jgi:hypothetical protein
MSYIGLKLKRRNEELRVAARNHAISLNDLISHKVGASITKISSEQDNQLLDLEKQGGAGEVLG